MTEYPDNDLFLKVKDDDQTAFEIVFLRHYANLCSYANTILGSKDTSEEIVQELFVKLWENRKSIEITTSLKAYLYRTAHNQCLNQIENWKVRNSYVKAQTQAYDIGVIPFSGDYPIANLIVKELEAKISDSIKALPEQCREIFLLIRVHNKSYQEVAQKLNISLNTVKTQMQRAVFKMKDMLQEYLPYLLFILPTSLF